MEDDELFSKEQRRSNKCIYNLENGKKTRTKWKKNNKEKKSLTMIKSHP